MKKDQKIYITEGGVRFRKSLDSVEGAQSMVKDQEVLFIDGPWLKVSKNGEPGWIHGDYVTEVSPILVADTGLPTFVVGQPNPTNGANTLKVREIIKDIFGLGKSGDCLNCTEYATYRIKTKLGIDISWPVTSGRNGG